MYIIARRKSRKYKQKYCFTATGNFLLVPLYGELYEAQAKLFCIGDGLEGAAGGAVENGYEYLRGADHVLVPALHTSGSVGAGDERNAVALV